MRLILSISFLLLFQFSFGQIKIFAENVISDGQVFGLAMSADGKDVLFVKAFGGRDTLQLYQSSKLKGKWQNPTLTFFADTSGPQIDPFYSPDGNTILFNQLNGENRYDVYKIEKTANDWGNPKLVSSAINTTAHEFYATMSSNKNIYFTRRNESNDIYVSHWKNNQYQEAIPLPGNVNTEVSDSNPYISPDEDFLIFISSREGGFGNADLYISFSKEGKWSNPLNLGDKINTDVSEFCPVVNFKNKRFYFSRTIIKNERRIENIYSIPLRKLGIRKLQRVAVWE